MPPSRRSWTAPLILIAATAVVAVAVTGWGAAAEIPRLILGLVAGTATAVGVRRHRPAAAAAWYLIAAGIVCWAAGDGFWTWADEAGSDGLGIAADALYFAGYAGIGAGIFGIAHARGGRSSRDGFLDGLIFAIAATIIVWIALVAPQMGAGGWPAFDVVRLAAYPIGDGLLLAAITWLAFTPGRRSPVLGLLAGGLALTLVADVLWNLGVRFDTDWEAWLNPLYPIAYAMIAAAALHPSMRVLSAPARTAMPRVHPAHMVLLGASIFVGPIAAVFGRDSGGAYDPLVLGGAWLVAALVVVRFIVALQESERARARAAASEERFRAVAEGSPVGIYEADTDLTIVYANQETERLFGHGVQGLSARDLLAQVDARDRAAARTVIQQVTTGGRAGTELRLRIDGHERWVRWIAAPVHNRDGRVSGLLASTVDITASKRAEEALAREATHDPLTGLPNRRLLFDRLDSELAAHTRRGGRLAVLFVDLDRFKAVNDTLGHEAGDAVLVSIAERLRRAMRAGDTIARFGGDEFVAVLVDACSPAVIDAASSRVLAAVDTPVDAGRGDEVTVTASIGVAVSGAGDDADELIRRADAAMYRAKADGRSRTARAPGDGRHEAEPDPEPEAPGRIYDSRPLPEMTQS
jgi:diguanylate cyclase (GGDEF)-like protein/PAS domain S-box-containing protein